MVPESAWAADEIPAPVKASKATRAARNPGENSMADSPRVNEEQTILGSTGLHSRGQNGAPISTWGVAGKASRRRLFLAIRPDDGDGCHKDIGGDHCTQRRKQDLVVHSVLPSGPFLLRAGELSRAFPASCGHLSNSDRRYLVPVGKG